MPELVVKPTRKWVSYTYTFVLILVAVIVGIANNSAVEWWKWSFLSALLFLWPISKDIRRRFMFMSVSGDKLRYESGMLSKTTRTIQLTKVQDVTVRQSLVQRMFHVGDLSIETAGETSRLTIADIDHPQEIADQITDAAQSLAPKRKGERA